MHIREPNEHEMDSIYLMGRDAWGSETSEPIYLESCRASKKYGLGQWYCLEQDGQLLSSIIIYQNCLGLADHYFGFGSIATVPAQRNKGFASHLIKNLINKISLAGSLGIFLYSEIGVEHYARHGFLPVPGNETDGLMFLATNGGCQPDTPEYF